MSQLSMPKPDPAIVSRRAEIVRQLKKLVPDVVLIADQEGRRTFETDALTAYRCLPLLVALPGTTEEVSKILRFCHDNHIKVVPRGAGTSLSGGALPLEDSIVLCLSRMNKVLSIDLPNRVARVEAGITNSGITQAVAGHGFFYAPDPSSQIACTVGGNVATNSGGAHCLKYGVTTNHILGVRLVLMDGEIIDIGGDYLDAPGYDLLALIIGSEGQLGVVTEVTVRLLKALKARARCCSASTPATRREAASPASSPPASFLWRSNSWTARRFMSASTSWPLATRSTSRRS
jgi:glycolate oxidase